MTNGCPVTVGLGKYIVFQSKGTYKARVETQSSRFSYI